MSSQHDPISDDALDRLLRQSLAQKPPAQASYDLALEAMTRARRLDDQAARLARLGRWMRWSGLAAGLLLTLTIALACMQAATSTSTTQESIVTANTTDSSSSETTTELEYAAFVVLAAVMMGLGVKAVLGSERPGLQLGPAAF